MNEVQRFDILGSPGSGKFTLSFNGSEPTTQIDHHPAAGDVQRALEALSTIGTGNVIVTKDGNWGYVCSFWGDLGNQNLPLLQADDSQLGGGGTIQVSVVTEGEPDAGGPAAYELPTPCSLEDLHNFIRGIVPITPSRTHVTTVTSSANQIVVTL